MTAEFALSGGGWTEGNDWCRASRKRERIHSQLVSRWTSASRAHQTCCRLRFTARIESRRCHVLSRAYRGTQSRSCAVPRQRPSRSGIDQIPNPL